MIQISCACPPPEVPPPAVGSGGGRDAALQALKKAKCPYAAAPFTAAAFPEVYRALFDGTA